MKFIPLEYKLVENKRIAGVENLKKKFDFAAIIDEEIMSGRAADGSLEDIRQQRTQQQRIGQMVESDRKEGAALLQSLRKHGKKRNP